MHCQSYESLVKSGRGLNDALTAHCGSKNDFVFSQSFGLRVAAVSIANV